MIVGTYKHPEDRHATHATLMYGAEFSHFVRGGKPGRISVSALAPHGEVEELFAADVEDIVCDGCNITVGPADPCVLLLNRLQCKACYDKYFAAHVTGPFIVR